MKNLKNLAIFIASIAVLIFAFQGQSYNSITTALSQSYFSNNAPYSQNCNSCHYAGLVPTKSLPANRIQFGGVSRSDLTFTYEPDQVYKIDLSTSNLNGWNAFTVCIIDSNGANAGTYTPDSGALKTRQILDSSTNNLIYREIYGNSGKRYTLKKWSLEWKSPKVNRGPLKMYIAMVASNSDSKLGGDTTYNQVVNLLPDPIAAGFKLVRDGSYKRCLNDSVTYRIEKPVATTQYNWKATKAHISTSTDSIFKIKMINSGLATITLTGINGGKRAFDYQDTLRVAALKPTKIDVNGDPSKICLGSSTTLTANTANDQFVWSTGETTRSITVSDTGTYTVWATDGSCASPPASVTIKVVDTILDLLTAIPDTVCHGSIFMVSLTPDHLGYIWRVDGSPRLPRNKSPWILDVSTSPIKNPGRYIPIEVKAYSFCPETVKDTIIKDSVFVKGSIEKPISKSLTVALDSAVWIWDSIPYSIGMEVSTDGGATWQSANGKYKHTFRGLSHGTIYNLMARGIAPQPKNHWCSPMTLATTIKTKGCGPFNYTKTVSGSPFCAGGKVQIDFGGFASGQYEILFNGVWTKDIHYEFMPTKDTTVRFEIRDLASTDCDPYKEVFPLVRTIIPPVSISKVNADICSGDMVTLNAASGFSRYLWIYKGVPIGHAQQLKHVFLDASNKVDLYVEHSSGCATDSATIGFSTRSRPKADYKYTALTADSLEMKFEQTENPGYYSVWDFGNGKTATGNSVTHKYMSKDVYQVRLIVANSGGCQDTMIKPINLGVKVGIAIAGEKEGKVVLYPNPMNGVAQFDLNRTGMAQIRVVGLGGQILGQVSKMLTEGRQSIDLSALPSGLYMIDIQIGAERWVGKVMKR